MWTKREGESPAQLTVGELNVGGDGIYAELFKFVELGA